MRRASAALAIALACGDAATLAAQQPSGTVVRVRDLGPGASGRLLRTSIAAAHVTLLADGGTVPLRRDTTYGTTVLVVGGNATVASTVRGDVIVVGGDLFLHPGATIDGRAVAIGGGVYTSTLAVVRGGTHAFRDHTFSTTHVADTVFLDYHVLAADPPAERLYVDGLGGFQLPEYTRVDGLVLPWGPTLALDSARIVAEPLVTYRSHLGAVDPSLAVSARLGPRIAARLAAGRGTFSNDGWIRPDPLNAASTFVAGEDTRNYYRADRVEARLLRRWQGETIELEPYAGVRTERAWSVGPDVSARSAPFSIFDRRSSDGMLRPNPPIAAGRVTSLLGGVALGWRADDVSVSATFSEEVPVAAPGNARFAQSTVDADISFPTFGSQSVEVYAHAVYTAGDTAAPQRFVYLGGSGTLLTLDLLEQGGDQLLFTESRYHVPLERLALPLVGVPTLTLRHLAGSAGVARLPRFTQNLGVRLSLSLLRLDFLVDPASRRTASGISLAYFR